MNVTGATQQKRQAGFSLVELMIAASLGLLLLAGVTKVFTASKQGFSMQQGSSRAQESGRFGTQLIARTARHAGYYQSWNGGFVTNPFTAANLPINGVENGTTDTLVVSLRGSTDVTLVNCLGQFVTAVGVTVQNTFSLTAVDATTGVRSLQCQLDAAAPVILMEGVTSLNVEYGEDLDFDTLQTADRYVTADDVSNWLNVRTVRITLVTNSVDPVGAGGATNQRLTQTYVETIQLRNRGNV